MPEEQPYVPLPVIAPDGRPIPHSDLPMPDLGFARPIGAWIIVAALFIVVVALWVAVAAYFSIHA